MSTKADNFVLAAMIPVPPKADMGVSITEALDWRFRELMNYRKWKLPDFRETAYTGERMYAHGMRAEMDMCELLARHRSLQCTF